MRGKKEKKMTLQELLEAEKCTDEEIEKILEYYLFLKIKDSGMLQTLNILRVNLNNVFK